MNRITLVALVALLGFSASIAKADGLADDPTVHMDQVGEGPGDPTCAEVPDATCLTTGGLGSSASDPLVVTNLNTLNLFVASTDNTSDIGVLFVEIDPVILPGVYTCESNLLPDCGPYAPPADEFAQEFEFCSDSACDGVGGIAPGTEFSVVVAPEPSALILLAMGLFSLLALKYRRNLLGFVLRPSEPSGA